MPKTLIHEDCPAWKVEHAVSRRHLTCNGCGGRPPARKIKLVVEPRRTESQERPRLRGGYDDPDFYFSPLNRRNDGRYGYPRI